jgi:hypothetical protein
VANRVPKRLPGRHPSGVPIDAASAQWAARRRLSFKTSERRAHFSGSALRKQITAGRRVFPRLPRAEFRCALFAS